MKSSYIIRAQKFMEMLFPYICDYIYKPYMVEDAVERFNLIKHRKVQVEHGSCRIALITSDYVIKWDYSSRGVRNFGGCENEYEMYQTALEDGYDYLFAAITPISINNMIFYCMPRVYGIGDEDRATTWTSDELRYIDNHVNDLHEYNYGFKGGKTIIIDYACPRRRYSSYS